MSAHTNCECGSHATGITTYTVTGVAGCCTGRVLDGSVGWDNEYEWNEGAWELVNQTQLTAQGAQDKCCPPG